jgi:hypothetical protein
MASLLKNSEENGTLLYLLNHFGVKGLFAHFIAGKKNTFQRGEKRGGRVVSCSLGQDVWRCLQRQRSGVVCVHSRVFLFSTKFSYMGFMLLFIVLSGFF